MHHHLVVLPAGLDNLDTRNHRDRVPIHCVNGRVVGQKKDRSPKKMSRASEKIMQAPITRLLTVRSARVHARGASNDIAGSTRSHCGKNVARAILPTLPRRPAS